MMMITMIISKSHPFSNMYSFKKYSHFSYMPSVKVTQYSLDIDSPKKSFEIRSSNSHIYLKDIDDTRPNGVYISTKKANTTLKKQCVLLQLCNCGVGGYAQAKEWGYTQGQ